MWLVFHYYFNKKIAVFQRKRHVRGTVLVARVSSLLNLNRSEAVRGTVLVADP